MVSAAVLQEMTRRLVAQFDPEQVILFGSHAWGTPDRGSDVDLMVIVRNSALSDYQRAVLAHHCLRGLPVPKDIVVRTRAEYDFYRQARASLERRVAEQGKVLYERPQARAGEELARQSAA